MFFKTKTCRNKLYIYPEVEIYVEEQSPSELYELGSLILETSHLLLSILDTRNDKKDMRFWNERISQNANSLLELLSVEKEHVDQQIIKRNNDQLQSLRYNISRTIQTLFSFEEYDQSLFKMNRIHEYFGKNEWLKN